MSLEFREIDVDRHGDECVRFRADSYAISFGSDARFFAEAGSDGTSYLEKLRQRNRDLPGSCVHAWLDGRIVGQIELRRARDDPRRGHVNLYYLVPELRGSGLAEKLDAYVVSVFRRLGVTGMTLCVSPLNGRAWAYYLRHGWHDRGPHPDDPTVHVMERVLEPGERKK